jgi:hypothetical protein
VAAHAMVRGAEQAVIRGQEDAVVRGHLVIAFDPETEAYQLIS